MKHEFALSPSQERILLAELKHSGTRAYYLYTKHAFSPEDAELVKAAIPYVFSGNLSLRIRQDKARGFLQYASEETAAYEEADLRGASPERLETMIADIKEQRISPLFDAPLYRLYLIHTDTALILCGVFHHLISDGTSLQAVLPELLDSAVADLRAGKSLEARPVNYGVYLERMKAYLGSDEAARDKAYWLDRLSGFRGVAYRANDLAKGTLDCEVPAHITETLQPVLRANKLSPFVLGLGAAFMYYAGSRARLGSKARDMVWEISVHGRYYGEDLAKETGMFVDTLPLRLAFDETKSFVEALQDVKAVMKEGLSHARTSTNVYLGELKAGGTDPAMLTTFSAVSNSRGEGGDELTLPDETDVPFHIRINLNRSDADGLRRLTFEYNRSVYQEGDIRQIADGVIALLEAAADDVAKPLGELTQAISPAQIIRRECLVERELACADEPTSPQVGKVRESAGESAPAELTDDTLTDRNRVAAALLETLRRFGMSKELLIGAQFAEAVVPFGMKIDSSMRASDFTEAIRAHLDALQSLAEYPISIRSDIDFTPSVALALRGAAGPARTGDGVAISVALSESGTVVRYDPSRYSAEFMDAFFASMKRLYKEMTSDRPLRDIPLVQGKADGFKVELKTEGTVNAVFASAVARAPEKTVVIAADRAMTYRELDLASNRIGNALIRRGVRPQDRILLLMRRRSDLLSCLFGAVKAGAVFITMDPEYPKARIDQIVEDSGAVYILSDIPENKAKYDNCIAPSELMGDDGAGEALPAVSVAPDDMCFIIYTSGTTGKPKGVVLTHGGITNYVAPEPLNTPIWTLKEKCHGMLCLSSVSFIVFLREVFGTLLNGLPVVLCDEEQMINPMMIARLLREHGIDALGATPTRLLQYTLVPEFCEALGDVKLMVVGGEGFPGRLYDIIRKHSACEIYNSYGPTEVTIASHQKLMVSPEVSAGFPMLNVVDRIADMDGNELPPYAVGELYVGGAGVAAGYFGNEALTAERFPTIDGIRYCNTGDLAYKDDGGEVSVLGRNDGMIKLRGLRIELEEIENALGSFPGVALARVLVREIKGAEHLCGFYTLQDGIEAPESGDIKAFIAEKLPPYMVPTYYTCLKEFPLTPNGKISVKALKALEVNTEEGIAFDAPRSEAEAALFEIVAEILGTDRFGVNDDLFSVGLTSLTQVTLMLEISERFGRDIALSDLRRYHTIAALAGKLEASGSEKSYGVLGEYPLTHTQLGIYAECLAHPDTTIYNIPILWKLGDGIDADRLRRAVADAIDAHPYLKARLAEKDGRIVALRDDGRGAQVDMLRLDGPIAPEALPRPFELLGGPLYRAEIYATPEGNYFYLDLHHIAADGRSRILLQRDIEAAYAGIAPEKERFTGYEVQLEEAENREGPRYDEAKAWFDSLLSDFGGYELPPAPDQAARANYMTWNTGIKYPDVLAFCARHNFTANAFFNAAFGYALCVYGASDDAVFTTIYDGRNDTRLLNTITMLVKTLPVRVKKTAEMKVEDLVRSVRDQLNGSMANDLYSFSETAREYGVTADLMVACQDEMKLSDTFCGEPTEVIRPSLDAAKSDLSIDVFDRDGHVSFSVEHRTEVYGEAFVAQFMRCMEQIVSEFLKKETLKQVCPASPEMERELMTLHDTDAPVAERPAYRLLEDSAAKWPDRAAVIANGARMTYGELNARANRMGRILRAHGAGVEKLCAVMLDRGANVYVARQGILKAGAAFLPIDPEYPDDRVSFILEDANCGVVVTSKDIYEERRALFDRPGLAVCFVEEAGDEALSPENIGAEVPFDALAYSIYTSGSTGRPKGVLLTQRNLVSFVDGNPKNREILGYIERGSVSLALASISFDVSIMEEFIPLAHGLKVCMANDEERHDHAALRKLCLENGVDIITCTPSLLANLLDDPIMRDVIGQLKVLDIGAEAFPAGLYGRIREQNADVYIMNGYGPTETTISCTMSVIDGSGRVTIGIPNSNVKVAVADEAGHALPMGALGELVILGEGVGRGYQNREDLTKKSFIRFWGRPAYRSGDLARILPDSEIEFKGRRDNQVKLRGFRVELDEIENVIRRFPGVRLAKVVVRNNGKEDYLVGFFTADADQAVSIPEMTEFLRKSLAAYMVPDVMQRLDEMPLTVNGKIDTKRLPDVRFERAMAAYEPPANELEKALCDKFAEILKLERVGANDDFFEIGGTSLSAMIVVSVAAAQGWNLVYKNIFEYATPRALAAYIAGEGAEEAGKEEKAAAETVEKAEENPDDLLKYNGVEFLDGIRTAPLGKVLLTGATGFLGIHMLRELIRPEGAESVVCMVRDKKKLDARKRIEALLEYYFNDTFGAELCRKVRIVRADVNDADLAEKLAGCAFDTIINCAAMVKHFARDDSIERVNVGGVRNMIEVALQKNAQLIQVSTESVAGYSVNGSVPLSRVFTEKDMDIGQTTGTRYTKSKLQAEKDILAAARDRGLRAKIMRVGNLMSRRKDGEFQINFHTNNFMNSLRAYVALGCFPVDDMDSPVEFSPIDSVSRALVLLSGTPERYTVFHVDNCHVVHTANILEALADCQMPLEITSAAEFGKRLDAMLKDERRSLEVSSLVSYRTDGDDTYRSVEVSNAYTVKALYRLGFSWPVITPEYMERAIMALKGLGFFDN